MPWGPHPRLPLRAFVTAPSTEAGLDLACQGTPVLSFFPLTSLSESSHGLTSDDASAIDLSNNR